ncbi:hypothetical protein [Allohahella sp. A8]|uniref:hypothetical protein n=1 Tax=Allohahella sp. A8 TaxID=3141461 RepID=UPI003A8019D8
MSENDSAARLLLPWHKAVRSELSRRWRDQGWPAALLLEAVRGSGKLALARHLAMDALCAEPISQPNGALQACGACRQCLLMNADSHPDFIVIAPADSRVIKVDQIRSLTDFAYTRPQVSKRKVAILDPADALNLQAGNALLKTLEEPGSDVTLILLSEQRSRLLPTVRSRCQYFRLPKPALAELNDWVAGRLVSGKSAATSKHDEVLLPELVAAMTLAYQFSPWRTLEALRADGHQQPVLMTVMETLAACVEGRQDIFAGAQVLAKVPVEELLDLLLWVWASVFRLQLSEAAASEADQTLAQSSALKDLQTLVTSLESEAAETAYQALLAFRQQFNEGRNPSVPLFLEASLMKLREGRRSDEKAGKPAAVRPVDFLSALTQSQQLLR